MKKLNVYTVYLDDGENCFKEIVPAESKKDACEYCKGNGEIISVKNNSEIGELDTIDLGCLVFTLINNGWGQTEIDLITRTLARCGLERY